MMGIIRSFNVRLLGSEAYFAFFLNDYGTGKCYDNFKKLLIMIKRINARAGA